MNTTIKYAEKIEKEKKEKLLLKSRKEVDINANGTSGYKIKEGINKDKVLGHITIKSKEI